MTDFDVRNTILPAFGELENYLESTLKLIRFCSGSIRKNETAKAAFEEMGREAEAEKILKEQLKALHSADAAVRSFEYRAAKILEPAAEFFDASERAEIRDIHCVYTADRRHAYFRMPLLRTKFRPGTPGKSYRELENLYGKYLRNAIISTAPKGWIIEGTQYEIYHLFVYNSGDEKRFKGQIPDADNFAARDTTNAVAGFLKGGDSPYSCAFRTEVFFTDEVPTGTYITVSGAESRDEIERKSAAGTVKIWSEFFKGQC